MEERKILELTVIDENDLNISINANGIELEAALYQLLKRLDDEGVQVDRPLCLYLFEKEINNNSKKEAN